MADTATVGPPTGPQVVRVALAYGGCEGTCPVVAYQVDISLRVSHFAGAHEKRPGFFRGECTPQVWAEISALIGNIHGTRIEDRDYIFDCLKMELVAISTIDTLRIYGCADELPGSMVRDIRSIKAILDKVRFEPTKDEPVFLTGIPRAWQYSERKAAP